LSHVHTTHTKLHLPILELQFETTRQPGFKCHVIIKKELLAIVFGCDTFDAYVYGMAGMFGSNSTEAFR